MRNHWGIYITQILYRGGHPPAQRQKSTFACSLNQFKGLAANLQPPDRFFDFKTDLKVGGEVADGASHLPLKNPVYTTQLTF